MAGFDPISAGIDLVGKFVDKFVPDKDLAQKLKAEADSEAFKGELQLTLGQLAINAEEAKSGSVWVPGWRPYVGWVCGTGLLYAVMVEPLLRFLSQVVFHYSGTFPVIDTTITMQMLFGLLGLGGMRTMEKIKGVAAK